MRIGIIGAGMAGLACARALTERGYAPVLMDKGRGVGGRLSTRRTDTGFQFDHGAQYITARDPTFRSMIDAAESAGAVGRWDIGGDKYAYVGVPGMTGLPKYLARGLHIRQGVEVIGIARRRGGWEVASPTGIETFDRLVVTAPAPQTIRLLGDNHPLSARLRDVVMEPCLTLMLGLNDSAATEGVTLRDPDRPISWIARDGSKPGRPRPQSFTAQASPEWSRIHLERDREEIARLMLPLACQMLGIAESDVRHAAAHRWRYALASRPLGAPFLADEDGRLFAGGDWCLAPRVEAAWQSGTAIAKAIAG